jgi:hypothetical protein
VSEVYGIAYKGAGWFVRMTAIGPMFGGTKRQAARFDTQQ